MNFVARGGEIIKKSGNRINRSSHTSL